MMHKYVILAFACVAWGTGCELMGDAGTAAQVTVAPGVDWHALPNSPYRIEAARLRRDWLSIDVSYQGGCKDHRFGLYQRGVVETNPPRVLLSLSHDANGETCTKAVAQTLLFDVSPLRKHSSGALQVGLYQYGAQGVTLPLLLIE